jgi:SAM-dependent methyltransferase
MPEALYDAVADFYEAGWPDSYDDSVTAALLQQIGPVAGRSVLDAACGHGRITRELARRGAKVLGVDISAALLAKAEAPEREQPLGVVYLHADITASDIPVPEQSYDIVICSFGLSDIDDLDGALSLVAKSIRPQGRFVFSILHPCFPGGGEVSGSWPTGASYYDEGRWTPEGGLSSLRRQVGANHRTLSTYVAGLRAHQFCIDNFIEPPPPSEWTASRIEAGRHPVFLVVTCSPR